MSERIEVTAEEAKDVCDMVAALMRTRESLGDETLYRALVGLIEDSRATAATTEG